MVVPVLYLEGWAFDRRQTCCRARYVARPRHGGGYPFVCKELTAVDRVDVADAYHRSAVRGCGWAESVPLLPLAASEAASHVLELRRRDNDGGWEWVEVFDISDRVNTQIRAAHAAAVSAARVESLLRAPAARTAWGNVSENDENDEDEDVVNENEDEDAAVVSEDENEVIIVEDEKENEFTAVFMSA
jgi:hypothetical protein